MKERLINVTSESQLRAGAIVVKKSCEVCGGNHRAMLISRAVITHSENCCEKGAIRSAWRELPMIHNDDAMWCLRSCIEEGRLYLVDVGDTRELTDEELAPKRKPECVP